MRNNGEFTPQFPSTAFVAERVLRAMDHPLVDPKGKEFSDLTRKVLYQLRQLFQCSGPVIVYPTSTLGAWEGAFVNTLSPNDLILICETGQLATQLSELASRLGLRAEILPSDWRRGVDAEALEKRLREDYKRDIKAICIAHNETSTGCCTPAGEIRSAIDRARHTALFMVDALTSIGAMDFRQDQWKIDVAIAAGHKALMLPRGLSFNALSTKAALAARHSQLPKENWCWTKILDANVKGHFPYSFMNPLFFGLSEVLDILAEEGIRSVHARHRRYGEATRQAVAAWELKTLCVNPQHYSETITAVLLPLSTSADQLRHIVAKQYDVVLGEGVGKVADKVFRIQHMGYLNDTKLIATLGAIEIGLNMAGIPHRSGGVQAAVSYLADYDQQPETMTAAS